MYEWKYLCALLESGYPLVNALKMLRPDLDIAQYLEEGKDIKEILLENQRQNFYKHLRFFLSLSSFQEAISCALRMDAFEKNIRKKLIQQTSYPILLFVFAFATLYVFSSFVIPQLMVSFDMEHENALLVQGVQVLRGAIYLLAVLLLFVLLIAVFSKRNEKLHNWLIQRSMQFSTLPADLCSYMLSGYLLALSTHGLSTKAAFSFLIQLPKGTLLHRCVHEILEGLEQGEDFLDLIEKEPLLNASFVQCYRIGMHSQNMVKALENSMERQEEHWIRLIKRIGMGIQAGAYSFVALMVILVYQIMLVPLQLLETM